MKVKGKDRLSKYLTDMVFVPYNIKFEPAETKFDWLSTDKKTVTEYVNCPYCGHNFTASFFYFLSKGLLEIYKDKNLLKIKKTLPIFIMYGSMDPVGEFGKGPKELYYFFIKNGYTTDIKSYEGFRHEIFNETNRTLAYSDLYDWLIKNIP